MITFLNINRRKLEPLTYKKLFCVLFTNSADRFKISVAGDKLACTHKRKMHRPVRLLRCIAYICVDCPYMGGNYAYII